MNKPIYRFKVALYQNKGDMPIEANYIVPNCGKTGRILAHVITKNHGQIYHWKVLGDFPKRLDKKINSCNVYSYERHGQY